MEETQLSFRRDLKRKAEDDKVKEIEVTESTPVIKIAKQENDAFKGSGEIVKLENKKLQEVVSKTAVTDIKMESPVETDSASAKNNGALETDSPCTVLKGKAEDDKIKENEISDIKDSNEIVKAEQHNEKDEEVASTSTTKDKTESSSVDDKTDPLGYTKGDEFTSEIFKIQIHNLPKFGYSDFKKRLNSLGLKPNKVKNPNRKVAYVCFRNEPDRQEAIQKLDGHVWKGKKLCAREAAPSADPFLEKKRQEKNQESPVSANREPESYEDAQKRLKDSVVPLWAMDYTKQLETKTEKVKGVLKKLTHHQLVREQFRQMGSWKQDGMPCPLLPIVPSPVTSEYRNKNEFSIGYSQDGKTIKVGFRYGLYRDGTTSVGDATNIGVVKPNVVPVIESFERFVSQSRWQPFLQQAGTGHWQTLTVRSFDTGDVLAMVDFHPRKLDKCEITKAKESIKDFYITGEGKDVDIKSFYFRLNSKALEDYPKIEKIYGESYVHESLLGLKFRISPEAFFQVNTKATENLYSIIAEWCEASQSSTVLDICCGTGTIGLSMAKKVKQVIGVEMCKSAVDDAKQNATLNDITNAMYYCSKVEDVIDKVLASAFKASTSSSPSPSSPSQCLTASQVDSTTIENDIIAVVDPPRAGLHKSVIKVLRKSEEIKRLVYVSCNPENAMDNFVDLIRPSSSKLRGCPFSLEKAIPVDLFPGTRHCEVVLLLTR